MDKYEVDCLIIGGGVAGLAAAKFLSQEFNKTYLKNFDKPYPVRSAFGVADLAFGACIEIEFLAKK